MTRPTIGLLLEGTYPFVRGGVSAWVHQLIEGLAGTVDFRLTYIGSHPQEHPDLNYELPGNVLSLDCFYLFDDSSDFTFNPRTEKRSPIKTSNLWRDIIRQKEPSRAGAAWCSKLITRLQSKAPITPTLLRGLMASAGPCKSPFYPKDLRNVIFTKRQFIQSKTSWQKIYRDYKKLNANGPLNNFFWHYQGLYRQIFRIAEIAQHVRPANCYHTISTGYAGILGAIINAASGRPLIVTEHGLYTCERRIDLNDSGWLTARDAQHNSVHTSTNKLIQNLWTRFFEQLSFTTYQQATKITTLYDSNRLNQIREGAPAEKTSVIRNGIDLQKFKKLNQRNKFTTALPLKQADTTKNRVALIGRVVSIKDITTFIKSISLLTVKHPNVEVLIVGPGNEQPEYVAQCRTLIELLGLEDTITLTGNQNVNQLLPSLDLVVLTSISEAQPLVLLEAMACQIPVVATNVGACREIIEGFDSHQPKPCGIVVPVTAPEATAKAMSRLLSNAHLRAKLGKTGRQRVEEFYSDKTMLAAYARTYISVLPKPSSKPEHSQAQIYTDKNTEEHIKGKIKPSIKQTPQSLVRKRRAKKGEALTSRSKHATRQSKRAIGSLKTRPKKLRIDSRATERSELTAIDRQKQSYKKHAIRKKIP